MAKRCINCGYVPDNPNARFCKKCGNPLVDPEAEQRKAEENRRKAEDEKRRIEKEQRRAEEAKKKEEETRRKAEEERRKEESQRQIEQKRQEAIEAMRRREEAERKAKELQEESERRINLEKQQKAARKSGKRGGITGAMSRVWWWLAITAAVFGIIVVVSDTPNRELWHGTSMLDYLGGAMYGLLIVWIIWWILVRWICIGLDRLFRLGRYKR